MVLLAGILKREELCIGGNVMPSIQSFPVSDSASGFYIIYSDSKLCFYLILPIYISTQPQSSLLASLDTMFSLLAEL